MQKTWVLSKRNTKEILRDPLTLVFGLGFPLVLLYLLSAIQANIPVDLFRLPRLTPGITVFGLSFMTLFSGMLLARDRESALLVRLYTAPLSSLQFILSYLLPLLPLSILQAAVTYLAALPIGLRPTWGILLSLLGILPVALFFISVGLLFGSLLDVKAVGGLCGALMTNLTAFLSGVWFDLTLVGGWFEAVANVLPFRHAVQLEEALLSLDLYAALPHLCIVLLYAAVFLTASVLFFLRQRKKI